MFVVGRFDGTVHRRMNLHFDFGSGRHFGGKMCCRPCIEDDDDDVKGGVEHSLPELDELQLPLPLHVVVSTTTSGWTTISCELVHDGGSSVMVVSDRSEPRRRRGT